MGDVVVDLADCIGRAAKASVVLVMPSSDNGSVYKSQYSDHARNIINAIEYNKPDA